MNIEKKITNMKIAGKILGELFEKLELMIKPGVSTEEINKFCHEHIVSSGAKPTFLKYHGFPKSICASVDDVIVHGIPNSKQILQEGQIIGIDLGATYNGYVADAARTYAVGKISPDKQKLINVARESFFEGIKNIKAGSRVGDIGSQVQNHVEKNGFSVVRDLVGHGVGKELHEAPNVPNYGMFGTGMRLEEYKTIAIEPMINIGRPEVRFNGEWDCRTRDGSASAHYENTVMITKDSVEIFTLEPKFTGGKYVKG